MSRPIDIDLIGRTACTFDATANVPDDGAVLIAQASGTDSSNGNWTAIRVNLTDVDTGTSQTYSARSDSEQVVLPIIVKESGRYRIQAVQTNFRETCQSTSVSGRELDSGFFD